jgi:hypothetical protein
MSEAQARAKSARTVGAQMSQMAQSDMTFGCIGVSWRVSKPLVWQPYTRPPDHQVSRYERDNVSITILEGDAEGPHENPQNDANRSVQWMEA